MRSFAKGSGQASFHFSSIKPVGEAANGKKRCANARNFGPMWCSWIEYARDERIGSHAAHSREVPGDQIIALTVHDNKEYILRYFAPARMGMC